MIVNTSQTENFWIALAQTKDVHSPSVDILLENKNLGRAHQLQRSVREASDRIDSLVEEFIINNPSPIEALVLGSAKGAHPFALAANHHVTVIEKDEVLRENLNRIHQQITILDDKDTGLDDFNENFDLVIATNLLPFIPPTNLQSTLQKIQRCLKGQGIFIGFIATNKIFKNCRTSPANIEVLEKLGVHFYEGDEHFVENLLINSEFQVEQIIDRGDGGFSFKAQKTPTR